MWRPCSRPGAPITSVTNAASLIETWTGMELRDLYVRRAGVEWEPASRDPQRWSRLASQFPLDEVWNAHQAQKRRLIRTVRVKLAADVSPVTAPPPESPRSITSPSPALTIGFARRFALYKRAGLIFRDLGGSRKILNNPERPVQILFRRERTHADLAPDRI